MIKAVKKETDKIIEALLKNTKRNFDIDKQDSLGNTALFYCIDFSGKTTKERLTIA